jgi:hypothetical protein
MKHVQRRGDITTTYQLASRPLRLLTRWDLPKSYELEDYESEDDTWFRTGGNLYNLNEFCRVGMPTLRMPTGSAQLASDGYTLIASHGGEVYTVSVKTERCLFQAY